MPTIDELSAAQAVADTDELPISQNGLVNKATRAQFLAGMQQQLALTSGQLLGRNSAGSGGPEAVSIGANLSLSGGILAASPANFSVPGLPTGATPTTNDLVALGQGGRSVAVPYAIFMGDAVPVEAFGATGDGVTDDTAALSAAVSCGRPVLLGPKTYIVNGQWTITQSGTVLIGVPGVTTLRRSQQIGSGAWVAIQADNFRVDGVIFDANRAAVTLDSWSVLVTNLCQTSDFSRCAFLNAAGATLGSGLVIQASDPVMCKHVVIDCEFGANTVHGIWVQACAGVQVVNCRAHDNGQYGIDVDFNDPTFQQKAHLVQVLGNRCWNNIRGISIGNYNATNIQPPVWGNANPDAISVLVASNICHSNSIYGIAAAGYALAVQGNTLSNNGVGAAAGAGILANVTYSRVAGNMISGSAAYGIDCGGSVNADISGNYVASAVLGINCGGGTNVRVDANTLQDCSGWAVVANNVETDGQGNNFGLACSSLAITGNWIGMSSMTAGGVLLRDGPQNVMIGRNSFVGSGNVANCLWANTDTVIIEGNRFNFIGRFICNPEVSGTLQQMVFPDIADEVMITAAPSGVQSMVSNYQAQSAGEISFIKIIAGGTGYNTANIAIQGSGNGAAASAMISNGTILGVVVTAPGSGYGPIGTTVTVSITGDGTGAAATAFAGAPLPEERRLLVRCNTTVHFARSGSIPLQENWTLTDIDVPANGDVDWTGTWGTWRAGRFPAFDYLGADGTGGAILRSIENGDVALHPNGTGHVRLTSDAEATGCISVLGRGTPEGVVTAPPGSDYRNLNGGAGSTWWVKLSGTDNGGWSAIA